MSETRTAANADWYADPSGAHQVRYWDGTQWTEHVADDGVQSIDSLRTADQAARALKEAEREAARQARDLEQAERHAARVQAKARRNAARDERDKARSAAKAAERAQIANNPVAVFGSAALRGGLLHYELKKLDMTDATAEATVGAPGRRSTFTRMGAGALIAGPLGLVAGAVAKKDTSKCYVTIETPDGVIVIEGRAKDYPAAVRFADAVTRSKR